MDYRAAIKASDIMPLKPRVIRIPGAGHHLFIDNPEEFNKIVIAILEGVPIDNSYALRSVSESHLKPVLNEEQKEKEKVAQEIDAGYESA